MSNFCRTGHRIRKISCVMMASLFLVMSLTEMASADQFLIEYNQLGQQDWKESGELTVENINTNNPKQVSLKGTGDTIIPHYYDPSNRQVYQIRFTNLENPAQQYNTYMRGEFFFTKAMAADQLNLSFNRNGQLLSINHQVIADKDQRTELEIQVPKQSQGIITNFGFSDTGGDDSSYQPEDDGRHGSRRLQKEKKPQSFYKKYFWYIVIGIFIVVQVATFDKDALNEQMEQMQQQQAQQAQQQQRRRR